jgi:hypothetical protein
MKRILIPVDLPVGVRQAGAQKIRRPGPYAAHGLEQLEQVRSAT